MRILMAASEFSPLARSGGLADSVAGLAGALARRGHEVCVVLPAYRHAVRALRRKLGDTGLRFTLPLGPRHEEVAILDALGADGVQIFLVKHDPFFDRAGLYGEGGDYPDNAARFILFAKAAAHLAGQIDPAPDIVHAHDWQAALVPLLLSREPARPRTVLSLHNVAYQGLFPGFDFPLTNLPAEHFGPDGLEFYGQLNLLKGGIASADALTTVSEVYRREILGPGGCGLEGLLQRRAERLYGFLDGADYAEWDPSRDPHLPKRYRPAAPAGKKACRDALLAKLKLRPEPRGPVFCMVTRLAEQKGFDILLPIIDRLMADDVRLVILGEGDPRYEAALKLATKKYRGKLAFRTEFDEATAHLIVAGSDLALIPSRFEPAGLGAIHALRYGTIPVARAVGGLHQILRDLDAGDRDGWSFLFYDYRPEALWDTIVRAKRHFAKPEAWQDLVRAAMGRDFSWDRAVSAYETLYFETLRGPDAAGR